jgi:hypothetical protein
MLKKQKETLNTYASVLRIPPEIAKPIVADFIRFHEANGSEWTVSRFKALKLDFIQLKAGNDCTSVWIAKEGNSFTGHIGALQSWCERNWKRWSLAIQLLQIYSTEISSSILPSQAKKFCEAVNYRNTESDTMLHHYKKIVTMATLQWFPKKSFYSNPDPLCMYPVSSTRREPHANGRSYPEGENTLDCAMSFIDGTLFGNNASIKYPNIFGPLLQGITDDRDYERVKTPSGRYRYVRQSDRYTSSVGKIGLIQEPGLKLRAVANPARVYQAALVPLARDLYSKLTMLPWDCTHEQDRPFLILQNHMKSKRTCHAVDLSNATDRFPLALQLEVLNTLYHRKDAVQLFADLSRGNWISSLPDNLLLSWKTGQPLGLIPSFAIFALTHGMLLYALNGCSHNDAFFVLGDDVVILDDALYAKYVRALEAMDIPYAPSKTISSNLLTEFGGKIITPDGVTPQLKWRHVSDDSFIDLAKHFGERYRRLMRPRQREIFDLVKVIPDYLGGCGFNPSGLPESKRIELYFSLLSDDNRQSYLMSYNGRIQSMNYSVDTSIGKNHWIYSMAPTLAFDQNAAQFATVMPMNFTKFISINDTSPWKDVVGNTLYTVYPRERFLPLVGTSVRKTTLEVLDRKFNNLGLTTKTAT